MTQFAKQEKLQYTNDKGKTTTIPWGATQDNRPIDPSTVKEAQTNEQVWGDMMILHPAFAKALAEFETGKQSVNIGADVERK